MRKLFIKSTWVLMLPVWLSCESEPPSHPPLSSVDWNEYTHPTLGYSIKYPGIYKLHTYEKDVIFRLDDYPVLVINYVNKEEALNRGLWAKHKPVDSMIVDSRQWRKMLI